MSDPIVEISDGKLKGKIIEDCEGEKVYAFLGIPFAKPPIGELRFKAPQPVDPWEGIRDATEDGSQCYQTDFISQITGGSEDCLYLNVFTKNLTSKKILKPVLFAIHGGAFVMGSNSSKVLSPSFLMAEDIVFVSTNYRLGVLGFLSLSDTSLGVPGNAGMKDQILALKWVRRNIKWFGGDPHNVTIWGASAGSASVSYLVLSPAAKGLFHKAVMQSGCALNPWANLNPKTVDIVKHLDASYQNEADILRILMAAPIAELIEAQDKLTNYDLSEESFMNFAPCVEKPNKTAFLTRQPIDIITSGDYNKVPMIIGYNSDESSVTFFSSHLLEAVRQRKYHLFIPPSIQNSTNQELKTDIVRKLQKFYDDDKCRDQSFLVVGDFYFVPAILGFIHNLTKTNPEPIYFWKFDFVGSRNIFTLMYKSEGGTCGACHGDEFAYYYDVEGVPLEAGSAEDIVRRKLVKLLANFVKNGDPTPKENELNITWKPVTEDVCDYLQFSDILTIEMNPDEERVKFWKEIYKSHEVTENFIP